MQYFFSSMFTKWRISNWSLIEIISTGSGNWVNMWPEEKRGIIAAVTILFLQKQCLFVIENKYNGWVYVAKTLLLFMFLLPRWMITPWQTRWACSKPKILWFCLPCALALGRSSHTVLRVMWPHLSVSLRWFEQLEWEGANDSISVQKYYLIIGMWKSALDGKEQCIGTEQVLSLL